MVAKRVESLQSAIAKHNGGSKPDSALIENSSKCARNWSSERILPDGTIVLPALVQKMVEISLSEQPYEHEPR